MLITDHSSIPNKHWQPKLHALGEIVTDYADIEQCIRTILLTEKGSVPTQPEKCTRIREYIDRRPFEAIPLITQEIFDALRIWEPRIEVSKVQISQEDFSHFRALIHWRAKGGVRDDIRKTTAFFYQA
jgi:uncharacterized protein